MPAARGATLRPRPRLDTRTIGMKNVDDMEQAYTQAAQDLEMKARQCISNDYLTQRQDLTRKEHMKNIIRNRSKDLRACSAVPTSVLFFLVYAVGMSRHENVTAVYSLESSLDRRFVRPCLEDVQEVDFQAWPGHPRGSLCDVQSLSDVWRWLNGDFIDTMFVQANQYGETLPKQEWSRVLTYNQVAGAVVLRQSREEGTSQWGTRLEGSNISAYEVELQDANEGFMPEKAGRRLYFMREETRAGMPIVEGEGQTGYEFELLPTMPLSTVKARLKYLEDRHWLDQKTNGLIITALLVNAELGVPRLETLKIEFSFSRGGGVFYSVRMEGFFLQFYDSALTMVIDGVFVIMLVIASVLAIRATWRALSSGQLRQYLFKIRTIVEWGVVLLGWLITVTVLTVQQAYMPDIRGKLQDLMELNALEGAGDAAAWQEASDVLRSSVEDSSPIFKQYATVSQWYSLVLMIRFFIAFQAQPRLAVVINTLAATSVDLLHFFIVFLPTFLAYVISGNLIFGRRMQEFSTISASIGECFKIVIENEFDWVRLSEENYWTTLIWSWSFLLVVVIIMLNMVLAIILDIYNEVRQRVDRNDTVFRFGTELGKQMVSGRQWIGDNEILNVLDSMQGSTTLTKADLAAFMPQMSKLQVSMLFERCRSSTSFEVSQELQRSMFLKLVASVKRSLERMGNFVRRLAKHVRAKEAASTGRAETAARLKNRACSFADDNLLSPRVADSQAAEYESAGSATPPSPTSPVVPPERLDPGQSERMNGYSLLIPGKPKDPCGWNPPLLHPASQSDRMDVDDSVPDWFRELDMALEAQETYVFGVQAQLQEMQWRLHHATMRLAGDLRRKEMAGAGPAKRFSAMLSAGGEKSDDAEGTADVE
eukprot:TRINITY_DN19165_c0_g1_i1.p1 TRINITY_DN19165_c0_g1~~TRINITY_DN19165_c0_g1_i1.p1  ORF type:complete len:879 (-),score=211.28 TRINITY_DN19165_c0_g1_i1:291-2927(-)